MKRYMVLWLLAALSLVSCRREKYDLEILTEDGVSLQLAQARKEMISELDYSLFFNIPLSADEKVTGNVVIEFSYSRVDELPVILDFKEGKVKSVTVNNQNVGYIFEKEHIILSDTLFLKGDNSIMVEFVSSDRSLNRRDDFMYTLLVPDRARTLFPCFDQPDMKGRYTLTLSLPDKWKGISNSPMKRTYFQEDKLIYSFAQSEPLSTYLFSFVAGIFDCVPMTVGERTISLYHRETDPYKVLQCDTILKEVFEAMEWLENYTAIKYPFAKYDFIVLPGFQFGGMEHTGATLYNDGRIFLNKNAGIKEEMARYSLIAHETAHMWFGDYVTMAWFNDVWTKEVFANYFAAKMSSDKFPQVNQAMNFVNYEISAFSEDRTKGAAPIKQTLYNLQDAGLIYSNIIYNKAPIVMNMIADKCGKEQFRAGIRDYLGRFAYSNATWEDLIAILDKYCDENLVKWSRELIFGTGIPIWNAIDAVPDFDTIGYGYYKMNTSLCEKSMKELIAVTVANGDSPNVDSCSYSQSWKGYLLINVNENVRAGNFDTKQYIDLLFEYLSCETDPILFSQAASYLSTVYFLYYYREKEYPDFESRLWKLLDTVENVQCKRSIFGLITAYCDDPESTEALYDIFRNPDLFRYFTLSEQNLTSLAFELAVRTQNILSINQSEILSLQRGRITNPDRLKRFDFLTPAVSCDTIVRDEMFKHLMDQQYREIEPWASSALALLNHPLWGTHSLKYIRPALDILPEIQKTGDIFFPKNWASALLSSHKSAEAEIIVNKFLEESPCSQMLKGKVRLVMNDNL
ncbi:MAG: M1 family aminopeptidase [Bacteroidales bacterium]|nr:M1 family aminopeptidase [Bacteroidales bacterium]MDD4669612.1 M1 family aminopeptidase [Bacteroidales bacterium]